MAEALTADDLSRVLLAITEEVLEASAGVVYLVGVGGEIELRASRGMPAVERHRTLAPDAPVPLAAAIAGRTPLFFASYADLLARYPEVAAATLRPEEMRSAVALPLVHAGRVLGGFAVSFASERTFNEHERRWLERIAAQAALAADRARLYEAEKRAREEAEAARRDAESARDEAATLSRLADALSATQLDLEIIVQHVTDEATRLVGAEFGAFFYNVLDAQGEAYLLYTLSGAPKEAFAKLGLPRNTPIFAPTFSGEAVVRLDDVKKDPRYGTMGPHHGMPAGHLPVTSYLAVPVVSRTGEVLGGLFFGHSQPGRFTAQHERITKSLAATAALAIDNAKLYRSARDAAEAQRRLAESLADTVRVNEMFMGVLAHDLRAPLTAVLTAAEVLRNRLAGVSDERNVKALDRIVASGQRMGRMIEQILDFTRVRVGGGITVEPRAAGLRAIVQQAIDELEPAHPGCRVHFTVDGDVNGSWDVDRLSQVFSNLIGNAIQHRARGSAVAVTVDGSDRGAVRATVHNRGAIPADLLPKVFEPLTAGERRRDRNGGLGIGLYITREIIRAHGGTVAVTSTEADGTTFAVTLPRAVVAATAAATPPHERAARVPSAGSSPLVTEELRQSAARFRLLVDSVRDYAIFMLDPQGRVMTWNAGARRIKGYDASEIIGQHFSRFREEREIRAGKCERELEVAARDGRFEDEGWRLRKDGSRFWANVVLTALRDPSGTLVGFAKVTRDLTERRLLEQERLRAARAEEAVRLRDEFLSLASHELKTPLTVLQMQLDALYARIDGSDVKVTSKLRRAAESSERLSDLIESLLDASRLASGKLDLELAEFDLVDCATRVIERLRPSALRANSELVLVSDAAMPGSWDRIRVEQLLGNLLANAIKYAGGKPIHISLRAGGDDAMLEVRDHGPGIPEQHLGRLFQRFERASSVRHYGGLGLGLFLIREIVTAHGGTVSAENVADGGALFRVRLPLRTELAAPDVARPVASA